MPVGNGPLVVPGVKSTELFVRAGRRPAGMNAAPFGLQRGEALQGQE